MVDILYYGSKAQVFHGTAKYTKGGLTKKDIILKRDKHGNERYKSKKQQQSGRKKGSGREKWTKAMKQARKELLKEKVIPGKEFIPVGGKTKEGKALLKRMRQIYKKNTSN